MPDQHAAIQKLVGQDIHVQADSLRIGEHHGDVMLIPRTWLADAMAANPWHLGLTMWWIGFGLVAGGGIGAAMVLTLRDILRRAVNA
jgi:hypothetical protein